MPLRILAKNVLDAATTQSVIYGTAVTGYPAANALTPRRSEVARVVTQFTSGVSYFGVLNFQIPVAAPVNCVLVARTNLPATGLVQCDVRAAGSLLNLTMQAQLAGDTALDSLTADSARSINNHAIWLPATYNMDQLYASLITVSASGTVEWGRVFAGVYYQTSLNFDWGSQIQWVDPSTAANTYGGDLIATYGGPRRRQITLPFNTIPEADRAYLFDLARVIGQESELFISMWPGSGGRLERDHQMWCRLKIVGDITNPSLARYGTSAVFTEC